MIEGSHATILILTLSQSDAPQKKKPSVPELYLHKHQIEKIAG